MAVIDEQACIGCTLCIAACPVDAIVGSAKRMHAVLPALCTGCALCVPPCPVDCIDMAAAGNLTLEEKQAAGQRGRDRLRRLSRDEFTSHGAEERKAILAELLGRE